MRSAHFVFKRSDFRVEKGAASSLYFYGYDGLKEKGAGRIVSNLDSPPPAPSPLARLLRLSGKLLLGEAWQWEEAFAASRSVERDPNAVLVSCHDSITLPLLLMKSLKLCRCQMVGISVGLSERMAAHTLLGRLLVKFIAKQADSLVYFSPDEKGALRKIGFQANQLHFLPFSVNASLFPFEAESGREEYDFVSVGRDPNRDFSSVAKLARSKPELRGLIITSASMAPPATELPHNLALKTDLPLEETLRQMRASRCVLLPTRKNTYSAATTTAILAMAIGRPAAISRIGEIAEAYGFVSGENCLILEPGEDLLPATARLLADSGFRTRLAVNARSLVENKLDQRSFAEQLASLIDAASAKKR